MASLAALRGRAGVVPAAGALAGIKAIDALCLAAIAAAVAGAAARPDAAAAMGAAVAVAGITVALVVRGDAIRTRVERFRFGSKHVGSLVTLAHLLRDVGVVLWLVADAVLRFS